MVGSVLRVRYELVELLNEGPIFSTFAALDRLNGREICVRVIKEPYASEEDFVRRIQQVTQIYSAVEHPGVEAMVEVDDDAGTPFLISELTKAPPLADRIKKLAPFSVPVAVSTAISLCEGLDALHSHGLAHGDVSSQNVAALADGQVRLQLPGLWRGYASSPRAATIALQSMSPYLAPEISAGTLPSPASDVYSAGVLLYELLTGRLPYNADTTESMAIKHASGAIPSIRMYNPSVPNVLDEIVKKSLSKDPRSRYPSAGAMLSDLRVLQDALRFGRTVTWPIGSEPTLDPVKPMPQKTVARKEARDAPRVRVKAERDIPLFLWFLVASFGAAAAMLVGIAIYFNMERPAEHALPSIVGLSVTEARDKLKPLKLEVDVDGHKASETVPEDHIISVDPEAGTHIKEGNRVHVIVSGGSNRTDVPNLKSNTVDQARTLLENAHLQLDENKTVEPNDKVPAGLVIRQDPMGGKRVEQGSTVKIVVSSGPENGAPVDNGPNAATPAGATNLYTIKVKLTNLPKAVTVRIDIVDDLGTRTVAEQEGEPEDTISLATRGTGKNVRFKIYYDNVFVKEVAPKPDSAKPDPNKPAGGDPIDPNQDNNGQ